MVLPDAKSNINIKIVVLAGGNSVRFNGIKQLSLVKRDGAKLPLLQQSINIVKAAMNTEHLSLDNLYVITGKNHNRIAEQITESLCYCDRSHQGMGFSISQSVSFILKDDPSTTHILFTLGDLVALEKDDYLQLLQKVINFPSNMICAETVNGITAPAIFPHAYFSQLQALTGDKGAKAILQLNQQQLIKIPMMNASVDIDTQEDLKRWNNSIK